MCIRDRDYSEETAKKIDEEVISIVQRNYDKAVSLLDEHIEILHKMSRELLEKEVLNALEIDAIIGSALPAEHAAQTS